MNKRVVFFEFSVNAGVYPLASGYIKATALENSRIRENFHFNIISECINGRRLRDRLIKIKADVYAFSCYVWNSGFIRKLVDELIALNPNAHFILGGPQVMNKAADYLKPEFENLVLCNGEGEFTFRDYLLQLLEADPDLSKVKGLSFYQNLEIITTPKQDRIQNLSEVPSPYLEGSIDASLYSMAVLETNRGCPFKCTYCYWGAATNSKVRKYSFNRVIEEITWLCKNKTMYLIIADANFGMLKRDVEIAEHLAKCRKQYGYPLEVIFNSSKNTPKRVVEITKAFSDAELIAAQPISLQTMSADTLKAIKRDNIKDDTYLHLQEELNHQNLSSFVEIIWPLPGETLTSFKEGIDTLCRLNANSFVVYPLLLINNVEMDCQQEQYGIKTLDDPDPNSEARIVIETSSVSNDDYRDGMRVGYHLASLYCFHGLSYVMHYLDSSGLMTYTDLISTFSNYCKQISDNSYVNYVESVATSSKVYEFSSLGGVIHLALHQATEQFEDLLLNFMKTLPCWQNQTVKLLFDLDILNRPHIYSNTPIVDKNDKLNFLRITDVLEDGYIIEVPSIYSSQICELLKIDKISSRLRVNYRSSIQLPCLPNSSDESNNLYCQFKIRGEVDEIMPIWLTSLQEDAGVSQECVAD